MKFFMIVFLALMAIASIDEKDKQRKRWDEIDWFFWRKW